MVLRSVGVVGREVGSTDSLARTWGRLAASSVAPRAEARRTAAQTIGKPSWILEAALCPGSEYVDARAACCRRRTFDVLRWQRNPMSDLGRMYEYNHRAVKRAVSLLACIGSCIDAAGMLGCCSDGWRTEKLVCAPPVRRRSQRTQTRCNCEARLDCVLAPGCPPYDPQDECRNKSSHRLPTPTSPFARVVRVRRAAPWAWRER